MTWSLIQPKKEDRISSGDGGCRQNRERGKGGRGVGQNLRKGD